MTLNLKLICVWDMFNWIWKHLNTTLLLQVINEGFSEGIIQVQAVKFTINDDANFPKQSIHCSYIDWLPLRVPTWQMKLEHCLTIGSWKDQASAGPNPALYLVWSLKERLSGWPVLDGASGLTLRLNVSLRCSSMMSTFLYLARHYIQILQPFVLWCICSILSSRLFLLFAAHL